MFKWLNKGGVESDKGYIFQREHRFYYHYIEGTHVLVIYVEPFTDSNNVYFETIMTSSFKHWQPPYESEILQENRVKEIVMNIDEALTFMEIDHKFSES